MKVTALVLGALGASLFVFATAALAKPNPHPDFVVLTHNAPLEISEVQDRSWASDNSVLLSTYRHDWYHVSLSGGCTNAGWGGIGFETLSGGMLDRSGAILAGTQRCAIASIDKIAPPPPGSRQ